jgi:hypothetical protein
MASYPKFPILDTSNVTRVDGYIPVRATNGMLRVRKTMTSEKREFTIDHFLGKTDKETLESFFQTNKTLDVTLSWPGEASTFTVRFVAAPEYVATQNYLYKVRVRVAQV